MCSEENNVLNEEISQLRNENERLRNMCSVMEQMSVLLIPIVNECKCNHNFNSIKIKTKLNVLKLKYDSLKSNQNSVIHSFVNKINNCSKIMPKIVIKKVENNEEIYETIDQKIDENNSNLNNEQIIPKKRSRGRPKKNINSFDDNEWKTEDDFNEIDIKIKKTKSKVKKTRVKIKRDPNFLSIRNNRNRAKNLLCQWPGCEQRFRDKDDLQNHMWRHTGIAYYELHFIQIIQLMFRLFFFNLTFRSEVIFM